MNDDYSNSHWDWVTRTLGVPHKEPFLSAAQAAHEALEFESPNAKAVITSLAQTMWASEAEVLRFREETSLPVYVPFEADMSIARLAGFIEPQLQYIVDDVKEHGDQELDPMFDPELNAEDDREGGIDLGVLRRFEFPQRFAHLIDPMTQALYNSEFDAYNGHIAQVAQGMEEDGLGDADSFKTDIDQYIMARLERLQAEYQGKRKQQTDLQKMRAEAAEAAPIGEKAAAAEYVTSLEGRLGLFEIPPAARPEFETLVWALVNNAPRSEVNEALMEAHESARGHDPFIQQVPYDLFLQKAEREAAKHKIPGDVADRIELASDFDEAVASRLDGLHAAEKKAIQLVVAEVTANGGMQITADDVKVVIDIVVERIAENERGPEKLRGDNGHITVPARFGDSLNLMAQAHANDMPEELQYEAERLMQRLRAEHVDVGDVTVADLEALPQRKQEADARLAQLMQAGMATAEANPVEPVPAQEDGEPVQAIDPIPEAQYRGWLNDEQDFQKAVAARREGDAVAEKHFLNIARAAIDQRYDIILNDDELARAVTAAIGGRFADMSFDEVMELDAGPTALDEEYARLQAAGERLPDGDTRNSLDDLFEPVYEARHAEGVDLATRNQNAASALERGLMRRGHSSGQAKTAAAFLRLSGVSKD